MNFSCAVRKKSNLCVAVDVTTVEDLLRIMDLVGPYVCCVKTHVDVISDWNKVSESLSIGTGDKNNEYTLKPIY